jgi:hypothetical protein
MPRCPRPDVCPRHERHDQFWTHIGNVQKFSITPTPTVQKHKGTQGPVKAVDFVNTSLIEMAFDAQCDEWTKDNVLMALLGQLASDTVGEYIKIGVTVVRRQIKFVGNNAIGPKYELILPSCNINAKEALNFIDTSDETAPMPLSGDILFDTTLAGVRHHPLALAQPAVRRSADDGRQRAELLHRHRQRLHGAGRVTDGPRQPSLPSPEPSRSAARGRGDGAVAAQADGLDGGLSGAGAARHRGRSPDRAAVWPRHRKRRQRSSRSA